MQWVQQLQFTSLWQLLIVAAASLLCITFHEMCHGLAAHWLGDDTAKRAGRLSLNPLRHIDPAGLVMLVFCHFGWARPVPVDMRRFRNPKAGMALTALAGPLSNVLLALVGLLLWYPCTLLALRRGSEMLGYVSYFFEYVTILSAGLAVFNIFPVPPLDGSKVLFAVLPPRGYDWLMRYERYGFLILLALLLIGALDAPLVFLRTKLLDGLQLLAQPYFDWIWKLMQ